MRKKNTHFSGHLPLGLDTEKHMAVRVHVRRGAERRATLLPDVLHAR